MHTCARGLSSKVYGEENSTEVYLNLLLLIAATYSSLIITFQNSQLCDASRKDDVVRVASLLNLGAELNGVEKVSFFPIDI